MSYSQILLTIRSQRHDERIRHDNLRRLVYERQVRPSRPTSPT